MEPVESDVLDSSEAGGLVVRGGLIRILGFVAVAAVSLLSVVLLTRYLGPDAFGRYQTVISLIIVVGAITDVGMATLGSREYAQRQGDDRQEFMAVLLGLRVSLTCIGIALAIVFAVAAGYGSELVIGTALAGVGLLLTVVQTTLAIPLGAELKLGTVTAMDVVRQLLTTAILVGLILAGSGLIALLAVVIPVQLVLIAWTAILVRGRIPLVPVIAPRAWRALLVTSAAFALAVAVGTIYQYTAQILTSLVAGEFETGLFSAAFRIYVVGTAVPGLLVASAFPLLSRAARDDHERLSYALRRLLQTTVVVGCLGALCLALGAQPIVDLVGGSEYEGSVPVLRLLAVALLVAFAIATWGFGLLSLHRHRPLVVANLVSLAVTGLLVLGLAAGPLGARGTAVGVVAGELVLAAGYLVGLSRVSSIGPAVRREPVTTVVLALACGLVASAIPGLGGVATTVVGLALFCGGLLFARCLPPELASLVPGRLARFVPSTAFSS